MPNSYPGNRVAIRFHVNLRLRAARVNVHVIAERISARQPTPGHILAICVCTYVRVGHA